MVSSGRSGCPCCLWRCRRGRHGQGPLNLPQPDPLADSGQFSQRGLVSLGQPGSAPGARTRLCFTGFPAESCAALDARRGVAHDGTPPSDTKVLWFSPDTSCTLFTPRSCSYMRENNDTTSGVDYHFTIRAPTLAEASSTTSALDTSNAPYTRPVARLNPRQPISRAPAGYSNESGALSPSRRAHVHCIIEFEDNGIYVLLPQSTTSITAGHNGNPSLPTTTAHADEGARLELRRGWSGNRPPARNRPPATTAGRD